MRDVDDGDVVDLEDGVGDAQSAIGSGGATGDELGDVNGAVIANVRVVGAASDAKTQAGTAPLQNDLLELPLGVAINLGANRNNDGLTKLSTKAVKHDICKVICNAVAW